MPRIERHYEESKTMKTLLTIVGIIILAMGLLWIGQGSGYIAWPASSFMISQTQWIYYGAVTAAVGLLLIIVARRR
jgi:hypothetical protein